MITNLKKNLNLSYQHIYMFTRRKCKDIIEKNRRKERSNMKSFKLRCKKLCAVVLMIVTAFGFSFAAPKTAKAANTKYWIKVNKRANVATVYQLKRGKYKPIKAFLVSCGGSNTPSGTFYTPAKYRWQTLMGPSYGQYCTRIHGGILFHSVCVRLSVADAKWIYDNCALRTKVTVYSSKNPGPLGKPKGIKVSTSRRMYWDPTDPDKKNPYRKQKATISISSKKAATAEYGTSYNIKSGVTAKDKITKRSLTSKVTYGVTKYSNGKYKKAKFSTKSLGTYRIKYAVKSSLGVTTTKTFTVRVVDTKAPVITAKNRTVNINTTNAVSGVSAKMKSGKSVTSSMSVKIKAPGAGSYTTYSYAKAKAYKFTKAGTYYVQYVAKNVNKPNRAATKTVKITVLGDAVIKSTKAVTVEDSATDDQIKAAVREAITITDNGTTVKSTAATITVSKDTETGVITATVSYKGKNGKTVTYKVTVTVNVEQEAQQSAEEQTDQPVEQ